MISSPRLFSFFFFNDTATTEIYTLSLHDALPISGAPLDVDELFVANCFVNEGPRWKRLRPAPMGRALDRKSTRLNSSHLVISYAVFCLKKKKKKSDVLESRNGKIHISARPSTERR